MGGIDLILGEEVAKNVDLLDDRLVWGSETAYTVSQDSIVQGNVYILK